MSETETADSKLFGKERRSKAQLSHMLTEGLIEILKNKKGNMSGDKYHRQFSEGYQAGLAYSLVILSDIVAVAKVTDTSDDIVGSLGNVLAESLKIISKVETYE